MGSAAASLDAAPDDASLNQLISERLRQAAMKREHQETAQGRADQADDAALLRELLAAARRSRRQSH